MINRKLLHLIAILSVISCFIIVRKNLQDKHRLSYVIFHAKNGWGYNIVADTTIIIHQEVIPAEQTQNGFESKQQAALTALLVINKLKQHKIPTIKKSEMQAILLEKEGEVNE